MRIDPLGEVSVMDTFTGAFATLVTLTVDDEGSVFVFGGDSSSAGVFRYISGTPDREMLTSCQGAPICPIETMVVSADRSEIIASRYAVGQLGPFVSIDPVTGSYAPLPWDPPHYGSGMATVPLHGDIDHSGTADLADYGFVQDCVNGPREGLLTLECDSSDLDADNDVDLFDFRFFQLAFGGKR